MGANNSTLLFGYSHLFSACSRRNPVEVTCGPIAQCQWQSTDWLSSTTCSLEEDVFFWVIWCRLYTREDRISCQDSWQLEDVNRPLYPCQLSLVKTRLLSHLTHLQNHHREDTDIVVCTCMANWCCNYVYVSCTILEPSPSSLTSVLFYKLSVFTECECLQF